MGIFTNCDRTYNTLMDHITNPIKTVKTHRITVNNYLANCAPALEDNEYQISLVRYILQKRQEVASSEILAEYTR